MKKNIENNWNRMLKKRPSGYGLFGVFGCGNSGGSLYF
jgi:hypothetical protein